MKRKILYFVIILLSCLNIVKAQTPIEIYHEDFESGAPGVTLNTTGVGSNSGSNLWIINNKYNGAPLYPNTPNENQTTGGTISFAPYSHYLHIYDQNSDTGVPPDTISDCNYNPTNASDRFVTLPSVCTLGITNVEITFYHVGIGSATAYAELYYSANYGPWTQIGTKYYNDSIWTYEVVQNHAFDNLVNLQFGFRWVNNAGSLPGNTSIGIDDIFIEGIFNNSVINFNVIIDSVKPNPICQNFGINVYYRLTRPICGSGFCNVFLSDTNGYFSQTPTQLGLTFEIANEDTTGSLQVTIPSNTPPGKCYKIRIVYSYTVYSLLITNTDTICFEVIHCPNTVTTVQPVETYYSTPPVQYPGDSVCVGSNILVPFWSTGVFKNDNKYIAELSDSSGNFPANPNIIGTSPDSKTYDPTQVPFPGNVSGIISESKQNPVPNGCNYYIRVVSTDPATIGATWGPFCIKHCDIRTNDLQSIQACLHSCAVGPKGFNDTVNVTIHYHNSSSVYNIANQFEIELLDPMFFSVVCKGCLGKITASNNTTLHIHIPCADSLASIGLMPGVYYMRIISTKSNDSLANMNGTLVFLTIGAPADKVTIYDYAIIDGQAVYNDSVLCVGDAMYFYPEPYNASPPMNSTYQWDLNGNFFSSSPEIGILFESPGTFKVTVQETNYGCKGPVTPNSTKIYILGTPNASIAGPTQVCLGDTITYTVPFQTDVFYQWTPSGGVIIDTSNNVIKIRFDTAKVYTLNILALNKCGPSTKKIEILVTKHQNAKFTVTPPSVCSGTNTIITAKDSIPAAPPNYTYKWSFDGGTVNGSSLGTGPQKVSWKNAGTYKIKLTVKDYGCATSDSNIVDVLQTPVPLFNFKNHCLGTTTVFTDSSQGKPNSWIWNFGDKSPASSLTNPTHLYADTGIYNAQLKVISSNGCMDTLVKVVAIYQVPTSVFSTTSPICEGKNSTVTFTGNAPPNASYSWNWSSGTVIKGEEQGPFEISWPAGTGTYTIVLSVSKNGCSSIPTTDSVNVKVCQGSLDTVSNVITSYNNWFGAKGKNLKSFNIKIFDRWGVEVYENDDLISTSTVNGAGDEVTYYLWNGNDKNGNKVSDGTYFYILNATTIFDNVLPYKKGYITVLK